MTITTEPKTDSKPAAPRDPGVDLDWLASKIEYRRFQECIHCGLCTASCPTYVETGNENDGPRGRIYLMRSVVDGRLALSEEVRSHLDLCLDCRACETACPSGVRYGELIEPFKVALHQADPGRRGWLESLILQHLFPYAGRVRVALAPARVLQRLGVLDALERLGAMKLLPSTLRKMTAMLPRLERPSGRWPNRLEPIGPKRATVAVFLGCVADAMYPRTTTSTIEVLRRNGCEILIPQDQQCCGAIHYHSGVEAPALDFARANIRAFELEGVDAVIVNAAGCGAMMKDYGHLLPDAERSEAGRFVSKVRDISEFLVELGPIAPEHPAPYQRVTYHDACHLCHAQGIRAQPRQLLRAIPELELVPLEESELCCGAAGTYNLTQPEMSERLGQRKMDHILETGAEAVVTGNVGCLLQIQKYAKARGASIAIEHPIDVLARAYRGDGAADSKR